MAPPGPLNPALSYGLTMQKDEFQTVYDSINSRVRSFTRGSQFQEPIQITKTSFTVFSGETYRRYRKP